MKYLYPDVCEILIRVFPKEYFDPKKMFVKHIPVLFYYC